ncbi:MAG: hypothetical protein Q9174_006411 [Haloplaca sp. 1 TL-2023]
MIASTTISTLALFLSTASLTVGLPQTPNAVSGGPAPIYPWSSHSDCAAPPTACKQHCTDAVDKICRQPLGLTGDDTQRNYLVETVGECTVSYVYEIGNTLPDFETCYNTFALINDKGTFADANNCGGVFGGALGNDELGNRTTDPVYTIQPKDGNSNCFMHPDNPAGKPLAIEELPGGIKLPIGETCPTALSRRTELNRRVKAGCVVAAVSVGTSITATCVAVGFGLGGPFGAAFAPFACAGAVFFATKAVANKCNGKRDLSHPTLLLDAPPTLLNARAGPLGLPADDPCAMTNQLPVCPNTRKRLLTFHGCAGKDSTGLEGEVVQADAETAGNGDASGDGGINF